MTFAKTETVIRLQAKLDAEGGDGELAAFVEEFDRLRASWKLSEEAARLLLGTGLIDQESQDRALTMLDRARAGASVFAADGDDGG